MNLKNVLRTYSLLRQLTNDESALLETLRSLSEGEREQLVESLSPGKVTKKTTTEKKGQCAACDHVKTHPVHTQTNRVGYHVYQPTRSRRASSLAEQIKSTGKAPRCVHEIDDNGNLLSCDALVDDPIHDKSAGYLGYHEFQSSSKVAAVSGD
jgi:hypothetical protein